MNRSFFKQQLTKLLASQNKKASRKADRSTYRPFVETLEDRTLLSTLVWDPGKVKSMAGGTVPGTWDTTPANNVWFNSATNTDVAWSAAGADDAVFPGAVGPVTVQPGGINVKTITFSSAYTLTGGTLTFTAGGGKVDVASTATISDVLAGSVGLTKTSAGTLHLNGASANTYTGNTLLTAGTLDVTNDNQLGNSTSNLIFNGGTLNFSGASAATTRTIQAVGANAGTLNATNTLTLNGPVTGVTSPTVSTSAPAILTLAGPGTIVLGGGGDNTNLGINVTAGIVTLAKNSSNTVHAVAAITGLSGGTLQLGGMGGDQIADGTGTFLTHAPFTIAAGGTFDLMGLKETIPILAGTGGTITSSNAAGILSVGANNQDSNFAGLIQDNSPQNTVNLTKVGTGTLTLSNGAANTYTGGTVISAGTISIGNDNLISTGPLTLNGGTLTYTGGKVTDNREVRVVAGQTDTLNLAGTPVAITGATQASPIVISTASTAGMANGDVVAITAVGGNTAANGVWTIAGLTGTTFQLVGSTGNAAYTATTGTFTPNTLTLTGRVHGVTSPTNLAQAAAVLTKTGPSALNLSGTVDNDNLGVNVAAGGLLLGNTSATVNSAVQTLTFSGTLANSSSFTLAFKGQMANVTYSTIAATLQGNIQVALDSLSTIGAGNTAVVANSATSVTITFQNTLSNMSLPDLVPGGGLTIAVATTTPGGSAHAVQAITGVASGTAVKLGGTGLDQVADSTGLFAGAAPFTMSAGAIFDLGGLNETLPTLAGDGTVTNNGAAAVLSIGANNLDAAFAGLIQDGSATNTLSLTKVGTGTITLSHTAANTYSGPTVLTGGALLITNDNQLSTGTLFFNGGALKYNGLTAATARVMKAVNVNVDMAPPSGTIEITQAGTNLTISSAIIGVRSLTSNAARQALLVKTGLGTLTLIGAGNNSNLGFGVSAGTLVLAKTSGGAVHAVSAITDVGPNGIVQLGGTGGDQIDNTTGQFLLRSAFNMSGGTFDLKGLSEVLPTLTGTGSIQNSGTTAAPATAATLTVGNHDANVPPAVGISSVFGGTIVGTGTGKLSLVKDGTGVLELTGANTYPTGPGGGGTTTITQGALVIGGGGTTGSISPNNGIVFGAAGTSLIFNRSDTTAYTGAITGTGGALGLGSVVKAGGGTLTLSGANNYSGGTTIRAGVLSIGALADAGTGPLGPSTGGANNAINLIGGTLQLRTDTLTTTTARNISLGKGTIDLVPITPGVVPGLTLTGVISNNSSNGDSSGVGANVNVSNIPGQSQYETVIAINPANPLNILASGNDGDVNAQDEAVWYTLDAGLTWSLTLVPNPFGQVANTKPTKTDIQAGDPELIFDKNGKAYFSHLTEDATNTVDGLNVSAAVSTDFGQSWVASAVTTGFNDDDKQQFGIGPDPNNLANQLIYITWHRSNVIQMASSTDGLNWTAPVQVSTIPNSFDSQLGVGTNGHLFVAWEDTGEPGKGKIQFATSVDGGKTFSTPVQVVSTTINAFRDFPNLDTYKIPAQPDRAILVSPSLVVDNLSTSAHKGRIYIAYNNTAGRGGHNNADVFVVSSDDEGMTWSAPVRVNDDNTNNSQFLPWMAIDPTTGDLAVSWLDARDDAANHAVAEYVAFSSDGGKTFRKNQAVSRNAVTGAVIASDQSGTTIAAPIVANPVAQAVTPASMLGIVVNSELVIGQGTSTQETVDVTAVTLTTFSAVFTNNHPAGVTVNGNAYNNGNNYGDYTGVAIYNGVAYPLWAESRSDNAAILNMFTAPVLETTGLLTKTGAGTLTLSGANTYANGTIISGGAVVIGADNNLGAVPAAGTATNAMQTITFGGTITAGSFKLTFNTGTQSAMTGDIPWNASKDVLSGNIQNALNLLSLVGPGNALVKTVNATTFTITFQGSLAGINLPTMLVTPSLTGTAATVAVTTTASGGKPINLTLDGGTLQTGASFTLNANRNIALTTRGGTFNITDAAQTLTIPGVISDAPSSPGALTLAGPGTLTLTGTNRFTGNTTLTNGSLVIGDGNVSGILPGNVNTGADGAHRGALKFNRSDNFVYGGAITGFGSLTQLGVGILILTNDGGKDPSLTPSNWSGGTFIPGSNGNTAPGELLVEGRIKVDGPITNDGQLVIKLADKVDFTFNGVISGLGFLVKKGNNVLTLGGVNMYTGFTEVNQGTLSISQDRNLGNVPLAAKTNVLVAGGTLQATATFPLAANRRVMVTSGTKTQNASFDVTGGNTLTINGAVTGSAPVFKIDAGTLAFGGTNSYTGGLTINAGTVQLDNQLDLGQAPATAATNLTLNGGILEVIANATMAPTRNVRVTPLGGTIMVDPGFTLTIGGVISADANLNTTPTLTKTGTGRLTLTGDSSGYTGGTNVTAGTLSIGDGGANGGFGGDIANSSAVIFNSSKSLTYNGTLDGGGTLSKQGTGTLTLTADSGPEVVVKKLFGIVYSTTVAKAGFTGATMVAGGTLIVTGSIGASAVTVNNNTTLGGSGTVGALTMNSGGHLLTNITSASASDNLNVMGTVTLDAGGGSVLDVVLANGLNIPSGTAFTILTSTGTISNKFAAGPGDIITIGTNKFKITHNAKTIVLTKQP
jgi:fibronectin-binding autotransporter adhesin